MAELQGILQDRTAQLELKEREVCDNRRCIEELNARLSQYERTRKLMSDVVLSCYGPLKQDLETMKSSVALNRSQSLEELHMVHDNLTELVKMWTAASEQIALDTETAATRKFDDSLNALQEKLESESLLHQDCMSENERLKAALDEKSSTCRDLADKLATLRLENESTKKVLLELELENDRMKADHRMDVERKDEVIATLEKAVDETNSVLRAKDDALEEMSKKFESERLEFAEASKKEQAESEEKLAEEIRRNLGLTHREEVDDIRREFERQLDEERDSVKRLNERCKDLIRWGETSTIENASVIASLQDDCKRELNALREERSVLVMELEDSKILVGELSVQVQQYGKQIEELEKIIENSVTKPEADKTHQENETEEPGTGRATGKTLTESEAQTDFSERVDEETQVESDSVVPDGRALASENSDSRPESLKEEESGKCGERIYVENESQTDHPCKADAEDAVVQTEELLASMVVPLYTGVGSEEMTPLDLGSLCLASESTEHAVQGNDACSTGDCELRSSPFLSLASAPYSEQGGKDLELQLRVDDYLPLQRHDEIITRLKTDFESEKRVAVQAVSITFLLSTFLAELVLKIHIASTFKSSFPISSLSLSHTFPPFVPHFLTLFNSPSPSPSPSPSDTSILTPTQYKRAPTHTVTYAPTPIHARTHTHTHSHAYTYKHKRLRLLNRFTYLNIDYSL